MTKGEREKTKTKTWRSLLSSISWLNWAESAAVGYAIGSESVGGVKRINGLFNGFSSARLWSKAYVLPLLRPPSALAEHTHPRADIPIRSLSYLALLLLSRPSCSPKDARLTTAL